MTQSNRLHAVGGGETNLDIESKHRRIHQPRTPKQRSKGHADKAASRTPFLPWVDPATQGKQSPNLKACKHQREREERETEETESMVAPTMGDTLSGCLSSLPARRHPSAERGQGQRHARGCLTLLAVNTDAQLLVVKLQ